MRRVASKKDSKGWVAPVTGDGDIGPPNRSNQDFVNRNLVWSIHTPKDAVDSVVWIHFLGLGIQGQEKMRGPCVLLVLRYNRSFKSSRLSEKKDMPKSSLLVKAGQIARFEVNKQGTGWAIGMWLALIHKTVLCVLTWGLRPKGLRENCELYWKRRRNPPCSQTSTEFGLQYRRQ